MYGGRRRSTGWVVVRALRHRSTAAALRTPAVKETLRSDFRLLPDLLAGPGPDVPAREEGVEAVIVQSPAPQQPADSQLDLFG